MKQTRVRLWTGIFALALSTPATLQETEGQRGAFRLVFRQRHSLGKIEEQAKRFGWKMSFVRKNDPEGGSYNIAKESFQVFVPEGYSKDKPHGIFVWVSPGPRGEIPRKWQEALAGQKLIGIGANGSGNSRLVWYRMGLALDAVHNMKRRYSIDESRVFISGFSGGGRIANRLGFHYPKVFRGGIYMGACDFYRNIPMPSDQKRMWPARFPKPKGSRLRQAKRQSRHLVLVGARDPNQAYAKALYNWIRKKGGFSHYIYLEMPGVGHVTPNAEWFLNALRLVEP